MAEALIELLRRAGLPLVHAGSTNGGEYKGACPRCRANTGDGGEDRLCVWPAQGRAWCRRCRWGGRLDGLSPFLPDLDTHRLATLLEGIGDGGGGADRRRERVDRGAWLKAVEKLVRTRAAALFRAEGADYRDYLLKRGLNEETLRAARLGAAVEERFYDGADFGLEPPPDADRAPKVCVPEGVVIPCFDGRGVCRKVQFRCADGRHGRYRTLPGSEPVSMLLRPPGAVRAAVIVESALDALLCHQEVGEGFAFVATGSTAYRPDGATGDFLRGAPAVLIATDGDRAGAEAAGRLRRDYPASARLVVPGEFGKDVGEAYLSGMRLRDWCEIGLEEASMRLIKKKGSGSARGPAAAQVEVQGLEVSYELIGEPGRADRVVRTLRRAEVVAVDIETAALPKHADEPGAALDPWRSRPRLLQATVGEKVYLFDLNKVPLARLAPLFEERWVAHNAVFDLKHLLQAEIEPLPRDPFCTMLCENALTNENSSLAVLSRKHLGAAVDKSMQDSDWSQGELSSEQLRYAALDAALAHRLWGVLSVKVGKRGRKKLCQLLHDAQESVANMEINGIGFDAAAHGALVERWGREKRRALKALRALAGRDLNPSSPAQVAAFLESRASKRQLDAWPRTKQGQLCTSAEELACYRDNESVAAYLEYRRFADLCSKFGEGLAEHLNPVTGRLHPSFRIGGARTGRFSSSGPNVQGLPRDPGFRRLFVPEPGSVFVRADYNQMQLRIAALLSGDARLLDAYARGRDVHALTASAILQKPAKAVTAEERALAKAIGFGILFGMAPSGLRRYAMKNYGIALKDREAERVHEQFFEQYPDLRRWQREQVAEAEATGCVATPMGRVRNFTREGKAAYHTAAMNTPIQGAEGEVMLAALARLPALLDPLSGLLVNCVHDELLVECPAGAAEEVVGAVRAAMEEGMRHVFPNASLRNLVEAGTGPTWADAK
jgi:DNA polymerase-1